MPLLVERFASNGTRWRQIDADGIGSPSWMRSELWRRGHRRRSRRYSNRFRRWRIRERSGGLLRSSGPVSCCQEALSLFSEDTVPCPEEVDRPRYMRQRPAANWSAKTSLRQDIFNTTNLRGLPCVGRTIWLPR